MTTTITRTELYAEAQQFYARQVRLLDGREFEAYAGTFTEDGEFKHSPDRPAVVTRAAITAELREFHKKFDNDPVVRRHWFNMLTVDPRADGAIDATYYALVVTTRPTGKPDISPSCVVYDVLVRGEDGELLLKSRRVVQDHLLFD